MTGGFQLSERYSFKSIWRITFPILVALVMEEMLGMIDTAFLGRVGEVELGASAIAGVYFTILYMLGFGFSIGVQIIIEHLGEEELAIANIVRSISEVPFVFSAAFASTAATLVSNMIGEGHPEGVIPVIRRVKILTAVTMLPLLLFIALCPRLIIGLFTDIPSLVQASVPTVWVMCAAIALTLPWNVYLQSVAGTGIHGYACVSRW